MMISGFVTGERPVLESCSCLCAARKSKLLDKCNGKVTEKQIRPLGAQLNIAQSSNVRWILCNVLKTLIQTEIWAGAEHQKTCLDSLP
jgi:hypothetical protein